MGVKGVLLLARGVQYSLLLKAPGRLQRKL
jgi:hypothetical protein